MLATLAMGWLHFALSWKRQILELAPFTHAPATLFLAIIGVSTILLVVLTLLVSRRRSRIAAAAMILLFALSIPTYLRTFTQGSPAGYTPLAEIQNICHLVALILLFLPASRAWFRREDEKPDLRATFS